MRGLLHQHRRVRAALVEHAGQPPREVARTHCSLPLPDHPGERLGLRVALVRDLRRRVPRAPGGSEEDYRPESYPDNRSWFDGQWTATPAPAVSTEPALVPIVTTAAEFDPLELAGVYIHRWPAQENVIRDWLLPLGLDTNHGYSKAPVPNSEVEKKSKALEKRLANAGHWGERARLASLRAQKTSDRRWKRVKARSREAYSELNRELSDLEAKGASEREYRPRKRELVDAVEAEMEGHWRDYYRAFDTCNREYDKWQRYCQHQRELLRALENLTASEKQMYELDDRKDQLMTVLKLALANLAMWTRDHFPLEYARATWQRLAPFFRLPGRVASGTGSVAIELRSFNDRQLNRDLDTVCTRLSAMQPKLPDGHELLFGTLQHCRSDSHRQEQSVA